MKPQLLRGLLAAAGLFAASQVHAQLDPQLDYLSPGGPLSEAQVKAAAAKPAVAMGAATYTYLRCYYRLDMSPGKPQTNYHWALDPSSGDYYRVNGYWWSGSIIALKNMFYSDVAQDTLAAVCQKTLAAKGLNRPVALYAAANNQMSYNHTIWSQDNASQPAGVNKLIVFGDSLSDTQNMYGASQWRLPNAKSWFIGRFSNDRVWVEYLAEQLKLPIYNWAIGGSAGDQHLVVPGLLQQVESWSQYMQKAANYRPENTLFTMLIGGNDLLNYGRTVDQVISDQGKALERIIAAGARHIVVLNLPNLARTPAAQASGKAAALAPQVRDYNAKLALLITQLQQKYGSTLKLNLFDSNTLFDDLLDHPAKYQVSNATQSCLDIAGNASLPYIWEQKPRAECGNPDAFVFWDVLHPTTHTHKLLGGYVANFVKAADPAVSAAAALKARR
ncbi:thermolabile hemolysin [Chromobacterium sp. Panama]|uniref:SGNH/GDSL hydrolase family protein n=1 Tax=Chromobacterium sp. Panama TaxID=2161826 RepID=UPI000D30A2AF|nr:SGNH/GDSL hydrolase family protein [Chromobacterium sp. Panama]PTU67335.1 thermolabile hemolysin [Chromobacterium sp. Panama]